MVKVRSEEETRKNTVQGSIIAYLNEKQGLNWIVGIIRKSNVDKQVLNAWLIPIRESYPGNLLLSKLEKACKENRFL